MYNMTIFGKNEILTFYGQSQNRSVWVWPRKKSCPQKTVRQHIRLLSQRPHQLIEIVKLHITLKMRIDKKNQYLAPGLLRKVFL